MSKKIHKRIMLVLEPSEFFKFKDDKAGIEKELLVSLTWEEYFKHLRLERKND